MKTIQIVNVNHRYGQCTVSDHFRWGKIMDCHILHHLGWLKAKQNHGIFTTYVSLLEGNQPIFVSEARWNGVMCGPQWVFATFFLVIIETAEWL